MNLENTAAIILAAGRGTRIGGYLPKVLYPVAGKPMVHYIIDTLRQIGLQDIYVVTGYKSEDVQGSLGRSVKYVHQHEQLGTGHALDCALAEIPPDIDTILVLNGDDSCFYTQGTLASLLEKHSTSRSVMSLLSAKLKNPEGLGRILRDQSGKITGIREDRDASESEKQISEVNIGCYAFNLDWVKGAVKQVSQSSNGEYYIVDTVKLATDAGRPLSVLSLPNISEWGGVNTKEELEKINEQMVGLKKTSKLEKKVFLFDFDNCLIQTGNLKSMVEKKLLYVLENVFGKTNLKELLKIFWDTYEQEKKSRGWVSMPELADVLADVFALPQASSTLKRLFYTLPFEQFVPEGTADFLTKIRNCGHTATLLYGDPVFQIIKFRATGLERNMDDYFVYEKLGDNCVNQVSKIYEGSQIYLIDDKLPVLEKWHQALPQATTIWLKSGPYQGAEPDDSSFRANHELNKLLDMEAILCKS